MRSVVLRSNLAKSNLPRADGPLCFEPNDAESALADLLSSWRQSGAPTRQLLREDDVSDECAEHDILFLKHRGVIQGYLTYRSLGEGTLQYLAEDPDGLEISNYFFRNGHSVSSPDLKELDVFDTRKVYKHVVFVSKIEALPNHFGYGSELLAELRARTKADLLIAHAVDEAAEHFFEKNDFGYPGIYNGCTAPEVVMAWCKPQRARSARF